MPGRGYRFVAASPALAAGAPAGPPAALGRRRTLPARRLRRPRRLEQEHADPGIHPALSVLLEPRGGVRRDLVGLLEQLRAGLRERGEALGVQPQGTALEVRVLAVEAPGRGGRACVLVDDLQVRA